MFSNINQLYKLIFENFKFKVKSNQLIVLPPDQLSKKEETSARKFIKNNKDFIISTINNNAPSSEILRFNLQDIEIPLSFAQEGLWFIEQYEQGINAYNISLIFKVSKSANLEILEKSIGKIVERHEVLRTLIKKDKEGHGYQSISDPKIYPLKITKKKVKDKSQLDWELEKQANHIYDLSGEFPIRVSIYELANSDTKADKEDYLSIVIHHIAFDGWSIDILLNCVDFFEYP